MRIRRARFCAFPPRTRAPHPEKVKCPSCSTLVFRSTQNSCAYCGEILDKRIEDREKTLVGLPNFFSLRDAINSQIRRSKLIFYLASGSAAVLLGSGIILEHWAILLIGALFLAYGHAKVWAAAACPKCSGSLEGMLAKKGAGAQEMRIQLRKFPESLTSDFKACPHCKADFDHSPGRKLREKAWLNRAA